MRILLRLQILVILLISLSKATQAVWLFAWLLPSLLMSMLMLLIIDEALSVGDAFFTQKCMRFLHKFIAEKTTLFVSHDISAVNSLCNRVVLMENGHIKQIGSPKEVTATYLKNMYEPNQGESHVAEQQHLPIVPQKVYKDMRTDIINASSLRNDIQIFSFNKESASFGKGGVSITDVVLQDQDGQPLNWIVGGEFVSLKIHFVAHKDIFSSIIGFHVKNRLGLELFGDNTFLSYRESPVFLRQGESACALFSFSMPNIGCEGIQYRGCCRRRDSAGAYSA